ncbi:MAG TPA: glycosyltransferase family 4 protein [Vicinamibacterales bacterium]
MRIVQANAVYDSSAKTPDELLGMYRTLTEWSVAVAGSGAAVSVVQRFHSPAQIERDGIHYEFVADAERPWLSTKAAPEAFIKAIARQTPDVVHVNGLIFPKLVAGIRAALGSRTAIVVQHHGGEFPIRGSGLVGMFQRRDWLRGLAAANAISFTARDQVEPWISAGVIGKQRILEIIEASTTMRVVSRERARPAVGVTGGPVILWVGRLTTNKDPLAVLDGLEMALPQLPGAQVLMVFGDDTLLESVEQRVRQSEVLRTAVAFHSRVAHEEMPNFYGAADVFVSGSHSEGSGYALIEAMAVGVVPVVTDIPSFRAIAGNCGRRWTPGDSAGLAAALVGTLSEDLAAARLAVKEQFERVVSWSAIADRTVREYLSVLEDARGQP